MNYFSLGNFTLLKKLIHFAALADSDDNTGDVEIRFVGWHLIFAQMRSIFGDVEKKAEDTVATFVIYLVKHRQYIFG